MKSKYLFCILLIFVLFSISVKGQSKDKSAELDYLSYFLESPIEKMIIKAGITSSYQNSVEELHYLRTSDSTFESTQYTISTNKLSKDSTYYYNIVNYTELTNILTAINENSSYLPSIKDFNISEKDVNNYLKLADTIIAGDIGNNYSSEKINGTKRDFYYSVPSMLDTLDNSVLAAIFHQPERWTSTTNNWFTIDFINQENEIIHVFRSYYINAFPWNLPWKIEYKGQLFNCYNINLSRFIGDCLPNQFKDKKNFDNSTLIMAIANYLWDCKEELPIEKDIDNRGNRPRLIITEQEYWRKYAPEQGFFQKAHTDKGDPRFMITNEDETFKFGIGGDIRVIAFYDFNGSIEHKDFVTFNIPVPSNSNSGQFALRASNTKFNIKAVTKTKFGSIIGFIETDFNSPTAATLRLRHAYVSFFGFTVGQTWTTFMDLEAAPNTVDCEGPNTQISLRTPMIKYTYLFKKKFEVAAAIEMPNVLMFDYSNFGIINESQRIPDIPFHFKYSDKFGHLQIAGIVRTMNYFNDTIGDRTNYCLGYGAALSGHFNLGKKTVLYFQSIVGKGIANYIQDLSFSQLDLVINLDNRTSLLALPMFGSYISVQQNWTPKLYSAIIYGFTKLGIPDKRYNFDFLYDHTHYFGINLFWDIAPYTTLAIEYLFGQRVNQTNIRGNANRVEMMIKYGF